MFRRQLLTAINYTAGGKRHKDHMILNKVEKLIRLAPGLTATELSQRLYGIDGYHSRVSAQCRVLVYVGRVERHGSGGPGDPYKYFPAGADTDKQPEGQNFDSDSHGSFELQSGRSEQKRSAFALK